MACDRCNEWLGKVILDAKISDLDRGFTAVHEWHVHVHQDQVVKIIAVLVLHLLNCLNTVVDLVDTARVGYSDLSKHYFDGVVIENHIVDVQNPRESFFAGHFWIDLQLEVLHSHFVLL